MMFNVSERDCTAGSTHRGSHARGRASQVRCRSCSGTRSGCPMPRLRSLSGGEVLQILRVGLRLGAVIATWEPHQAPTQGSLAGPGIDPFRIIGRHSARCIPLREVAGSNARLTAHPDSTLHYSNCFLGSVLLDNVAPSLAALNDVLVIVKPETIIGWHRDGFLLYWRWRSRLAGGRPAITEEIRGLIRRLAEENSHWRAPKIHGELLKLGFVVSERRACHTITETVLAENVLYLV